LNAISSLKKTLVPDCDFFAIIGRVSACENVIMRECLVLMTVLTDVTKLTILTSLTLLFHAGFEVFSAFHFELQFSTKIVWVSEN
jgi:hypothetical protein